MRSAPQHTPVSSMEVTRRSVRTSTPMSARLAWALAESRSGKDAKMRGPPSIKMTRVASE
jgi:hypothetical protein